jgi:hypothetical protein
MAKFVDVQNGFVGVTERPLGEAREQIGELSVQVE